MITVWAWEDKWLLLIELWLSCCVQHTHHACNKRLQQETRNKKWVARTLFDNNNNQTCMFILSNSNTIQYIPQKKRDSQKKRDPPTSWWWRCAAMRVTSAVPDNITWKSDPLTLYRQYSLQRTFGAHKSPKGRSSGPITVVLCAPLLCLNVIMVALCWELTVFWPVKRPKVGACDEWKKLACAENSRH